MPNSETELHGAIGRVMGIIVDQHTMVTNTALGESHTNAVHNARARIQRIAPVGVGDTEYGAAYAVWIKSLNNLLTMVPMIPRQPVPQMMKTAKADAAKLSKYMKKRSSILFEMHGAGKLKFKMLNLKGKRLNKKYQMNGEIAQSETERTTGATREAKEGYRQSNMTHITGLPAYQAWERSNSLVRSLLEGDHKKLFDSSVTSIGFFLADSLITY